MFTLQVLLVAQVLSLFWAQVQLRTRPYRFPEVRAARKPPQCHSRLTAALLTGRPHTLQDNALKLMVECVVFVSLGISLAQRNRAVGDGWRSHLRLVLSAVYVARAGASRLHGVVVHTKHGPGQCGVPVPV